MAATSHSPVRGLAPDRHARCASSATVAMEGAVLQDIERVDPDAMRRKLDAGTGALLVCAHEDEDQADAVLLEGAITLQELEARREHLTSDQEIVFYCDCAADEVALERAHAWRAAGFDRAKILEGGVVAARNSGFRFTHGPLAGAKERPSS